MQRMDWWLPEVGWGMGVKWAKVVKRYQKMHKSTLNGSWHIVFTFLSSFRDSFRH